MDSFQLFLIKTLVGMSNRGVVGMLCTMDMHRLYIRSNNTNSQCKYDARTNFYIIFFLCSSLLIFYQPKTTERKTHGCEKKESHTLAFILIKERGVKDTCIFIFLPNKNFVRCLFFRLSTLIVHSNLNGFFFVRREYYIICRKKNDAK